VRVVNNNLMNIFKIDLPEHSLEYNKSIDGLRGIAVILVILFHLFPNIFPFGFVGVDIFFVISGYLITTIIIKQKLENKFNIWIFYRNRIRRIFPAMLVVVIFSLIMGYLFFIPNFYEFLGKHVNAVLVFQENFRLIKEQSNYWDIDSKLKPLLHFWSLSIEEQFYIIWPIIVSILLFISKNRLFYNFTLVCFIFISMSFYLKLGYYHSISRFWELSLGGVLASLNIHLNYLKANSNFSNKIKDILTRYQNLILVLFLFSILYNYDVKEFNILKLLLVDISTFLVIFSFIYKENEIFSKGILWYSGVISYSLYLWHHVLLSFSIYFDNSLYYLVNNNNEAYLFNDILRNILVILLSYFFSHLTYKYIELPFRKVRDIKIIISLLFTSFLFIQIAHYIDKNKGLEKRFHINFTKIFSERFNVVGSNENGIKLLSSILGYKPENNGIKSTVDSIENIKKLVVLIGDSHAWQLYEGLEYYLRNKGYDLLVISNAGDPPFYKYYSISSKADKVSLLKEMKKVDDIYKVLEYLEKNKKIDKVIFSCRLIAYYMGYDYGILNKKEKNDLDIVIYPDYLSKKEYTHELSFIKALESTFDYFNKKAYDFYFVIDNPNLGFDPQVYSYRPYYLNNIFKLNIFKGIDKIKYEMYYQREGKYHQEIFKILKKYPKIKVIDLTKVLCDNDYCYIVKDGLFLYRDENHLSIDGSFYVAPYILDNVLE
jgi:peptidoglycan/LPS O-acetylase OafA/YrhL